VNAEEQQVIAHVIRQVDAGKASNLRLMNLNGASIASRFGVAFPLTDEVLAALGAELSPRSFAVTQDAIGLIVRHT